MESQAHLGSPPPSQPYPLQLAYEEGQQEPKERRSHTGTGQGYQLQVRPLWCAWENQAASILEKDLQSQVWFVVLCHENKIPGRTSFYSMEH